MAAGGKRLAVLQRQWPRGLERDGNRCQGLKYLELSRFTRWRQSAQLLKLG